MIKITRTNSVNQDFRQLIAGLDQELVERYGETQEELDKNNVIESNPNVVIAYDNSVPAGCGCYRIIGKTKVEIKRMYVVKKFRGVGISKMILLELEQWAFEEGFQMALLETGKKQLEAIHFYFKSGYKLAENFPPYIGNKMSVCMNKELTGI